jgi:hypothetical protein
MSPSATVERAVTAVRRGLGGLASDPPPTADTRELTIQAFMRETHASRVLVTRFVDTTVAAVEVVAKGLSLKVRRASWHPDDAWLDAFHDRVFARAMPDDTPAAAGSAHSRLQELCGERVGFPVTLTHTRTGEQTLYYCALAIGITAT